MTCSKCGLEVDAGAAFCGNCGQPVQAAQQPPAVAPTPSLTPAPVAPAPQVAPVVAPAPAPSVAPIAPAQSLSPISSPVPSPGIPAPSPLAAAVSPAPSLQPAPLSPLVAPQAAMPASGPAYGNAAALAHPGSNKAIAAFVLGVIGLIGWIIPIVGLTLGILALIFGTMTTKSSRRKLAISGVVLGSITIFLSLCAFVYNIQAATKQQAANNTSYSTTAEAVSIVSKDVVAALTNNL
jgi:hypothetical protein